MLTTSATHSPHQSVETARFAERQLLRELERRREHQERLSEHRDARHGVATRRVPFVRRLGFAARAFVDALRAPDTVRDGRPAPAAAHR